MFKNIQYIISNRRIDPHHAQSLVYEWEDDFCRYFKASLFYNRSCQNKRYSKYLPFVLYFLQTSKPSFTYEMCVQRHNGNNKRNIIPCILDFYIHNPFLAKLWSWTYFRNPYICVSSPEVYHFLSEEVKIKKVRLLPLSLSDRYRITEDSHFEKKYDLFFAGRQNIILKSWFDQYCESHSGVTYVCSKRQANGEFRFFDNAGRCISEDDSRETYVNLMRASRASLYSPQGIDGSRNSNGFSQVTPRFLEIVACGCHPILRYADNADSRFFNLSEFCPSIESYAQFAAVLDAARSTEVDMKKHSDYMKCHYTSVNADILKSLLKG